jgi:hypothetical protein
MAAVGRGRGRQPGAVGSEASRPRLGTHQRGDMTEQDAGSGAHPGSSLSPRGQPPGRPAVPRPRRPPMATFHTSSGTADEATVPQASARATTRLWWAGLLTLAAAVGSPGSTTTSAAVRMGATGSRGSDLPDRDRCRHPAAVRVAGPLGGARPTRQRPPGTGWPCLQHPRPGWDPGVLRQRPDHPWRSGATLAYGARRRSAVAGHGRMALAAMVIGAIAAGTGMGIWLVG